MNSIKTNQLVLGIGIAWLVAMLGYVAVEGDWPIEAFPRQFTYHTAAGRIIGKHTTTNTHSWPVVVGNNVTIDIPIGESTLYSLSVEYNGRPYNIAVSKDRFDGLAADADVELRIVEEAVTWRKSGPGMRVRSVLLAEGSDP